MNRLFKEIIFSCIALALLMTIVQTPDLFHYMREYPLFKVFVLLSIPIIGLWVFSEVNNYRLRRGILYYCLQKFKSISIPLPMKYIIVIVLIGNLIAIGWGKQRYPFYDVGMYRYPAEFKDNKIFNELKYYYWQGDQYKIVELRKEGSLLLAEHFGRGYSHDLAYSMAYFHKGQKENFQFLSHLMKERGVDTLWVGVHAVNFETHDVTFNPDICHAIQINRGPNLYYGQIYIPEYQTAKCDAH